MPIKVVERVAGDKVKRRVVDAERTGVDCPGPGKGASVEGEVVCDRIAIAVGERRPVGEIKVADGVVAASPRHRAGPGEAEVTGRQCARVEIDHAV